MTEFYWGQRVKRFYMDPVVKFACSVIQIFCQRVESGVIPIIFYMKNRIFSFAKGVISARVGRSW